jgi:competence protein ComEC
MPMLWLTTIRQHFSPFWERHPALFVGLSLLLGTAPAFHPHLLPLFLFAALCCTARSRGHLILALISFLLACGLSTARYPKVVLLQEKIHGTGQLHIQQIKHQSSPFSRSLLYAGVLEQFVSDDGQVFHDLPCAVYRPPFGKHPPADTDYRITGTLCQKGDYAFVLKPDKKVPWEKLPSAFNLSEWRFQAKQSVSAWLKNEIADPGARTFLNALATGVIDERILSMEFGKIGLQHLLAISGFHFALAAFFLNFLFRLFLPYRISAALLIAMLTLYYLFLGNAPSILRAYIAISMVAAGHLFSWRLSGLNALGSGLIVELLVDPLSITQTGFQLTFLCTFAILLYYPILSRAMTLLLPQRSAAEARSMSLLDKHGYLLSSLLRSSLALNFSVHLIALPVLLYHFHKFPLLSLAYNLFFPVCAALSMLLLCAAFFFAPWLPFLSHAIHALNNLWTSSILGVTSNPPALLDFSLRCKNIPFSFVLCFLALSFFCGVWFSGIEKKDL